MYLETLKKLDIFKKQQLLSLELLKHQGYCNNNYKLITSKNEYLIRVFQNNANVNISREFEFYTQKIASKYKIAPKPFVLDTKNALMVTEFVKGTHKVKLKNKELKVLVKTIKKFHSFKIKEKEYNIKKDFLDYRKTLKDTNSKRIIQKSLIELKKIKKFKKTLVLTHHDLNPKNIIFKKNKVKIIDWEYAGYNDLFFDLASICCEFNLSQKKEELLLKTYLKKTSKKKLSKLHSYKVIYKNLCWLWFKSL